jgi:hypothetical protein
VTLGLVLCEDLNIIDQILAMAFSRMPRLDMATDAGHLQVGGVVKEGKRERSLCLPWQIFFPCTVKNDN